MRVPVYFVFLGQHPALDLKSLTGDLNRIQKTFRFALLDDTGEGNLQEWSLDEVQACSEPPFFTHGCIFSSLQTALDRRPDLPANGHIIVVTNVRVTEGQSTVPDHEDDDYFGIWTPRVTGRGELRAVISYAIFQERYQERSRRTLEQYVAYMVVAGLGDNLYEKVLTHPDFRFCTFDYNSDLDSIVPSLRRSGLCESCAKTIRTVNPTRIATLKAEDVASAFDAILRYVHRPRFLVVLRALAEEPLFSLVGVSIGLSVVLAMVSQSIEDLQLELITWLVAGMLLFFTVGWILKQHFRPGRLFR